VGAVPDSAQPQPLGRCARQRDHAALFVGERAKDEVQPTRIQPKNSRLTNQSGEPDVVTHSAEIDLTLAKGLATLTTRYGGLCCLNRT
jgi:hypothetical protein